MGKANIRIPVVTALMVSRVLGIFKA